jgi:catechol 2,3-dioxygenase-like lactoylglutathione lyase family enzyme
MIGEAMVVATVPVTDLERAKAFYGGPLGLTFLWENPAFAAVTSASSRSSNALPQQRSTRSPTSR